MITVAKDGSGDYTCVQEAIDSITSVPETVFIKNGIYKERVEIHKDNITLIGENADGTVITNNYYASMPMEDGSKRGTFRSYTFFVQANHFNAYNITFENSAGFGKKVGQAIAVYAEGDDLVFKNCHMLGHQDTLFTGPLPMKEKQPGGFVRQNLHRAFLDVSYMKIVLSVVKSILSSAVQSVILKTVNYMP